jgi:hypothetical protein
MTQFASPAVPSEGLDFNELYGSLLLIKVIYLEEHVPNVNSVPGEKSPAVRADVTVLDGSFAGKEYADALIFPRVMQGQLRSRVGQLVLGRLGKGEAKAGKTAPWKLDPASEADTRVAEEFMRRKSTPAVQSVSSSQPPF